VKVRGQPGAGRHEKAVSGHQKMGFPGPGGVIFLPSMTFFFPNRSQAKKIFFLIYSDKSISYTYIQHCVQNINQNIPLFFIVIS
jgi:hypothetical protein